MKKNHVEAYSSILCIICILEIPLHVSFEKKELKLMMYLKIMPRGVNKFKKKGN